MTPDLCRCVAFRLKLGPSGHDRLPAAFAARNRRVDSSVELNSQRRSPRRAGTSFPLCFASLRKDLALRLFVLTRLPYTIFGPSIKSSIGYRLDARPKDQHHAER